MERHLGGYKLMGSLSLWHGAIIPGLRGGKSACLFLCGLNTMSRNFTHFFDPEV